MCWCNPSLRTPQCGAIGCVPPKQIEVISYTPEECIEPISLIDFTKVWESSVAVGDCRHLWDYLNYNAHIKLIEENNSDTID